MALQIRIFSILLLFTAACILCSNIGQGEKNEPNVIFIIGDDISWDDIGCYGNKGIETPNLDKLAAEGMLFNNVFLTSSSCSPSRTSILTGRYPHNTGAAELHTPLPAHLTYFPELLKKGGYFTALVGKWHEGKETKRAYDTLMVNPAVNGDGAEEQWVNLLKSRPRNKPFFFWLAPFDAHRPWTTSSKKTGQIPSLSELTVPPTLVNTPETRTDLRSYYQEITRLDFYVGELRRELESQGIADNTVIIFMADNGRPFPGSKTRLYDRGIKTPFIINWPKGIKPGQTCNSLISSIDIAPTILALAHQKPTETMQGQSCDKLLKSPKSTFRNYIFAEHNWHDYEAYERSVRTADYLYLINQRPNLDNGGPIDANQSLSAISLKQENEKGKLADYQKDIFLMPRPSAEFYDNKKDPLQGNNLIGNREIEKQQNELARILKQWQEETGDTEPTSLTPDWYDRVTGKPLPANGKRGEMPGASKNASHNNAKGPF